MNTRYRIQTRLFGKPLLVLQVLKPFSDGPLDLHGLPAYLAGTQWRDARVEDLNELLAAPKPDTPVKTYTGGKPNHCKPEE